MSTYVITGTSKGIGLELTSQLLSQPSTQTSHIFALSRGKPTPALQDLLAAHGDRVTHITCTVDSDTSVQDAADEIGRALGGKRGVDVLVNNAGIGGAASNFRMEGYSSQRLNEMLNTNVTGVHRMTVAMLPLLRKGEGKKIVNL